MKTLNPISRCLRSVAIVAGICFHIFTNVVIAEERVDITKHVLSEGYVGMTGARIQAPGVIHDVAFRKLEENGVGRSVGRYSFAGIAVGEVVVRLRRGIILEEYVDIPLLTKGSLSEAASGNQESGPTMSDRDKSKQVVQTIGMAFKERFGSPVISYSSPGGQGESNKSVTFWKSSSAAWRVELFFSDSRFLLGDAPHFARITILQSKDIESTLLDPDIFLYKQDEIRDRLALQGVRLSSGKQTVVSMLRADVEVEIKSVSGMLRGVKLNFLSNPSTSAMVSQKYSDPFLNVADHVISERLRSYPSVLTKNAATVYKKDYLVYDSANELYYTYTDTYTHRFTEQGLVWSPGSRGAHYRLYNRTLEVLPPEAPVNPLRTLSSGETLAKSFEDSPAIKDFNLPALSFSELKRNVIGGGRTKFIDIPMEDQGELPLCLPASMARILRYFGKQVNQYTLAKLGGTDMRGTDWTGLRKIILTCAEKFGFRVLVPAKDGNLGVFIKNNIDNGIPMLWLIPGHARIINGYDLSTGAVLYTDSYGPGFEVQSMPYAEAEKMTEFIFAFIPPSVFQ